MTSLSDNKPVRAGKGPISIPFNSKTKQLEKQIAAARKSLETDVYDDLDALSEDESYGDDIIVNTDRKDRRYANLDTSDDEEEDDDEEDSPDVSRSLSSDDEESEEESRSRAKKRKAAPPVTGFAAKAPRHTFAEARQRCEQMEADAEADVLNQEKLEHMNQLKNTIAINLKELESMNETILVNIRVAQDEIVRLEAKERAQTEDQLFVCNHDQMKKDLLASETTLANKTKALQLREESLAVITATHTEKEKDLERRVQELADQQKELEKTGALFIQQQAAAHQDLKKKADEFAEQQQKATAAAQGLKKAASVTTLKSTPLDAFLAEMNSKNQNLMSRDDMIGIVSQPVLNNLAYLAGRQPLKYTSIVNGQFLILEVNNTSNADSPQLLMRQIVSKQLYTPK